MKINEENSPVEIETPKEEETVKVPEFLEINVFDKVAGKAVGPGQR